MKTNLFSTLIACFVVVNVFSQTSLNDYKYVIVPNKFDFLSKKDQYQLNSLTKFLFNKYGFQAVLEGSEYPQDLMKNRCLALNSDVIKDSGMFKTKLSVELKGCNDQVLYTSEFGESREKEYAKAYTAALRDAFKSFKSVDYNYAPKEKTEVVSIPVITTNNEVNEEIQKLREEIQNFKKEKKAALVEVEKTAVETPVIKSELIPATEDVILHEVDIEGFSDMLYAQEIDSGFQLVDSSPKVVYIIKKTGLDNVFLVDGKYAVIYKKGDAWIYEYNTVSGVKQNTLHIKF